MISNDLKFLIDNFVDILSLEDLLKLQLVLYGEKEEDIIINEINLRLGGK